MNDCNFVGRIASDPEKRTTQSGISQLSFRLAVNRRYRDNNGERKTDFFNCVAWRGTADYLYNYAKKGDPVAVRGSMQNRTFQAQDGSNRYVTELMIEEADLFGGSRDQTGSGNGQAFSGFTEVRDDELPF